MFGNVGALGQGMFGGLGRVYRAGNRALHPYSNRLMLAGLGMLGGGPSDAMKGLVAGSALDTEDADRRKLNKALAALMESDSPLIPDDPAIRGLMGADDKFAEATLLQRMKPADLTDMRQNYNDAVADGSFTGGFFDYIKAVKESPTYQIGPQETAGAKGMGEGYSKQYFVIQDAGNAAADNINNVQVLGQTLADPTVYTGAGGETVAWMKNVGQSLGFNVTGVDGAQVAQSLSSQMTMRMRNPDSGGGLPGSVSNQDRQWLQKIPPNLQDTKQTIARKVEIITKLEQRKADIASLAAEYAANNPTGQLDVGWERAKKQWVDAHPLFANEPPITPDGNSFAPGG
jgi:hypothetical protein